MPETCFAYHETLHRHCCIALQTAAHFEHWFLKNEKKKNIKRQQQSSSPGAKYERLVSSSYSNKAHDMNFQACYEMSATNMFFFLHYKLSINICAPSLSIIYRSLLISYTYIGVFVSSSVDSFALFYFPKQKICKTKQCLCHKAKMTPSFLPPFLVSQCHALVFHLILCTATVWLFVMLLSAQFPYMCMHARARMHIHSL